MTEIPAVLVVQQEDAAGPGIVGAALAAEGLRLDVRHPWRGEPLPEHLGGVSGLLVLGGAANCDDDTTAPWLPSVRALVRQAVDTEVPLLGICLGAQIMASALGGRVRPRAEGAEGTGTQAETGGVGGQAGRPPEVGVVPLRRLPDVASDPVLCGVPEGAPAAQWHWDDIVALPPGATPLLTGDACEHQAFRIGRVAWGVQFHPEVTGVDVAAWAASDGPAVRKAGADPDAAVAQVRAAEPELRTLWTATTRAWAAQVRAAHRPND
ncbi:type 1 glutamine amidotransferase [Streptacidiphilus fuscans]|uniref:type 1 glutamine amidotransferase n=1 Tax=Streptacidiphilus fuscans TaxID=2789292 RepID=UPI002E2A8851|nr:type 1 glutamine amidotransferase [Streptacidiphilus fuscans]